VHANRNFIAFAMAGVVRMLHESDYKHLPMLNTLACSSDASLLEQILTLVS
jgi:hypothetical protein